MTHETEELPDIQRAMEEYSVADLSKKDAYAKVLAFAEAGGYVTQAEFNDALSIHEISHMERWHGDDPRAKFKSGKYKVRTYMGTYCSAKTVLGQAIENNIPLRDADGKAVGKSAAATPYDKCGTAVKALDNHLGNLTGVERANILGDLVLLLDREDV